MALLALLELATVFLFAEIHIWYMMLLRDDVREYIFPALLVVVMLFSQIRRRESLGDLGFGPRTFWPASRIVLPFTLISALFFLAWGAFYHRFPTRPSFAVSVFTYPFWALAQQYAFQSFTNRCLRLSMSRDAAVIATSFLFGFIHYPNALLMVFTTLGCLVWSYAFSRYPNLIVISISQGLLASLLNHCLPEFLTCGMVIGPRYYLKGCL